MSRCDDERLRSFGNAFPLDRPCLRDDPSAVRINPAACASARALQIGARRDHADNRGRRLIERRAIILSSPTAQPFSRRTWREHRTQDLRDRRGCAIKVGMTLGVGNDPDREASRKNFRNGKTDSIDAIEPLEAT
jgi:hypothetical protein